MSIEAINWALKNCDNLRQIDRHVLLLLANYSHPETHECFPAFSTLLEQSGIKSRETLRLSLRRLENEGHIRAYRRLTGKGRRTANLYVFEHLIDAQSGPGVEGLPERESALTSRYKPVENPVEKVPPSKQGIPHLAGGTPPPANGGVSSLNPKKEPKELPSSSAAAVGSLDPEFMTFPIVGNGGEEWSMGYEYLIELSEAFPDLDIKAECQKARAWLVSNNSRRKTARGMKTFLFGWLERGQNSGRAVRFQPNHTDQQQIPLREN